MVNFVFKYISLKRNFTLFFIFFLAIAEGFSQETIFEEKTTIYAKELSGGIGAHTNGFVGTFRYGKYLTGFSKRIYEIEIANIRHVKEIKSINPFEDNVRGYVFGKINALYVLRPSIGFQKVFVPKQSITGVSITYIAQLGPSLGLTKPIYLNIIEREPNRGRIIVTKKRYDPEEHQQGDIYGRASFLNGITEMKLYPGIFAKLGLHFDFASSRDELRSIEVGLKADAYFSKVPIMAFTENSAIYPNLYLAMFFGSRSVD